VLRVLGFTGISGCVLLLLAIVRRREKRWPQDGHGRAYFSSSSETRLRH
jgi:hypothetical protein